MFRTEATRKSKNKTKDKLAVNIIWFKTYFANTLEKFEVLCIVLKHKVINTFSTYFSKHIFSFKTNLFSYTNKVLFIK